MNSPGAFYAEIPCMLSLRFQTLLRVTAVIQLAACSTGTGPDNVASTIHTDATAYTARQMPGTQDYSFRVIAIYRNEMPDTVFLANCFPGNSYPVYGVIDAGSPSVDVGFDPAWACLGHDKQIAVSPGQSRTDTLNLFGPTARDGRTGRPVGVLTGRFRLLYEVQACRGDGSCRLPQAAGISNAFRVSLSG